MRLCGVCRGERHAVHLFSGREVGATCRHCGRDIVFTEGSWVDTCATGDDAMWRETCDHHETFTAEHEPETESLVAHVFACWECDQVNRWPHFTPSGPYDWETEGL